MRQNTGRNVSVVKVELNVFLETWYDSSGRTWWGMYSDSLGNQLQPAWHDRSRDLVLALRPLITLEYIK
jgi:hypothetical protein